MRAIDYYSTWSAVLFLGFLVCVLVAHRLGATRAAEVGACCAIANATVVGLLGAYVIAFGAVRAPASVKLQTNVFVHALPAFGAACLALRPARAWDPCIVMRSAGVLAVAQLAYLALPSTEGHRGFHKISTVYGVPGAPLVCVFLALQFALMTLRGASCRCRAPTGPPPAPSPTPSPTGRAADRAGSRIRP